MRKKAKRRRQSSEILQRLRNSSGDLSQDTAHSLLRSLLSEKYCMLAFCESKFQSIVPGQLTDRKFEVRVLFDGTNETGSISHSLK